MADYPNDIFSPREIENASGTVFDEDKKTTIFAEDIESLAAEIIAIQQLLGTDPLGDFSSVKEYIESFNKVKLLSSLHEYYFGTDPFEFEHGLGRVPKMVIGLFITRYSSEPDSLSFGFWTPSVQSGVYFSLESNVADTLFAEFFRADIFSNSFDVSGVLSCTDEKIKLTFSMNGTPGMLTRSRSVFIAI